MITPAGRGRETTRQRMKRFYAEGFCAMDVAEPLVSFDAERRADEVLPVMVARDFDRVGIRQDGVVTGFVERAALSGGGLCGDHRVQFDPAMLVDEADPLPKAIAVLAAGSPCFVTLMGHAVATVTLDDMEKPPVRIFLFGMITVSEMLLTDAARAFFPDDSWRDHVPSGRLAKAEELLRERERRHQRVTLLDCLQFSDKAGLLMKMPKVDELLGRLDIPSRNAAREAFQEIETLRNNLAHSQAIVPESWRRIAVYTTRLDWLLDRI